MAQEHEEQHEEYEGQKEIFHAILAGYVKHKIGGGERAFELWQDAGSEIVKENWLHILSIYTVLLRCCRLPMVYTLDTVLQGDDAKYFTSFCYSKFLANNAIEASNGLYVECAKLVSKLLTEDSTNVIDSTNEMLL